MPSDPPLDTSAAAAAVVADSSGAVPSSSPSPDPVTAAAAAPPPLDPAASTAPASPDLLDNPDVSAILSEFAATPPTDDAVAGHASSLLDAPEHIGYLKELGLDFGWGPSSFMQWILEHIHVHTGLPWWSSIVLAAAATRVLIALPLFWANESNYRLARLTEDPQYKALGAKISTLMWAPGGAPAADVQALRSWSSRMRKDAGVSPAAGLAAIALQAPLGFGMWRVLRSMADIPVPALETGGAMWFMDLSTSDPYYLLPVVNPVLLYFNTKLMSRFQAEQQRKSARLMMVIMLPLSFIFSLFMPGTVQIYLISSLFFNVVFTNVGYLPSFRRLVGLAPLQPLHVPTELAYQPPRKPSQGFVRDMVSQVNELAPWAQTRQATEQRQKETEKKDYEELLEARRLEERRAKFEGKRAQKKASDGK